MNRFKYTPLDAGEDEIRLIRLLPGAFSDNIEIEIFHTNLQQIKREENHEPRDSQSTSQSVGEELMRSLNLEAGLSYEALSYVWGSEENPAFASIREDQSGSSQLAITRNLDEAMRYLRKEDHFRTLWIDAVCINQEDLTERGVQVGKMGDIFKHATQVAVWLGPEAEHGGIAVDLVHTIAADLTISDDGSGIENMYTAMPGSNAAKLLTHPDDFKSGIQALQDLCRREWFSRLWIYQEYHLSKVAIGIVGTRTLDMRILFKVIAFLYSSPMGEYRRIGSITHVRHTLRPIRGDRAPTQMFQALKNSQCSDERDRVYGILGLLNHKYRERIVPDYLKSVQDVNKAYFLSILNIQPTVNKWGSGQEYDSPSWIPSLTNNMSYLSCDYRASGNSQHEISYESKDDSLRTAAKSVGAIAKIWFVVPKVATTREMFEVLRAFAQLPTTDNNYTLGGSWLDAYTCAISGGRYREVQSFPWIPSLETLRGLIESKDFPEEILDTAQGSSAFRNSKGHAFFTTADGLIGLCSILGKVGDRVFIIPGADAGVLLSCVEGQPNHYRLKGECYVQGLMNSEALLGPLPTAAADGAWTYCFQYVQGSRKILFTNGAVTTQHDPRLNYLPEGWKATYQCKSDGRYHTHEYGRDGKMRILRFKNIQTRKVRYFDPRMTAAALRARGVDLENIVIV